MIYHLGLWLLLFFCGVPRDETLLMPEVGMVFRDRTGCLKRVAYYREFMDGSGWYVAWEDLFGRGYWAARLEDWQQMIQEVPQP
jgi:hypothetical protein